MEDRPLKTITLRLDPSFHKRLKLTALERGTSMTEYIMSLILADMEKQEQEQKKGARA
jgi:predicted HicB family RNase H-like nuclease